MKVKIGNRIYDGTVEPIMVILTPQDKVNIAAMSPDADRYAHYSQTAFSDKAEVLEWMGNDELNFEPPENLN